jgi:hypothetical protein
MKYFQAISHFSAELVSDVSEVSLSSSSGVDVMSVVFARCVVRPSPERLRHPPTSSVSSHIHMSTSVRNRRLICCVTSQISGHRRSPQLKDRGSENLLSGYGCYALHRAVIDEHAGVVEWRLAEVNRMSSRKATPLPPRSPQISHAPRWIRGSSVRSQRPAAWATNQKYLGIIYDVVKELQILRWSRMLNQDCGPFCSLILAFSWV